MPSTCTLITCIGNKTAPCASCFSLHGEIEGTLRGAYVCYPVLCFTIMFILSLLHHNDFEMIPVPRSNGLLIIEGLS